MTLVDNATYETRYDRVNEGWPTERGKLPKPTAQEAISGARLLIKEAFRYYDMPVEVKRKRKFKITSGNRHTWPRSGVWYVNPDERGRGWAEIVHSISHYAHHRRYPDRSGHDGTHFLIEQHLAKYVLEKGWLDGKLKRAVKEKAKVDPKDKRFAAVLAGIKRWESKRKRAETALKKLRKQKTYYEKKCQPT